ncbi:BatA and WFA domain-containing protein [Gramella jeungdoensis]|uniref:BatA and WFA domain-containing protein n=1 Tax=Gramella jeungdoensis TaxID=708091 RepID=A0ABT0Z3E5_9FLAO|nr:BatA and WFA domain-containing protein [Gramella jeungdoensis]MCM8570256.1 BatA and WFA domain-containing protein [Gramella jeungdoensis]
MHFQHPELLYALFLLIIPLIVHLFRLRRFQKEDFTNVKFLKKVIQETRKSSRLKKFLILITRLLLLTCLILAFAQPFIPASNKAMSETKTLIYLDNSFSMQAGDGQSSIFQRAVTQLLENLDEQSDYALFTNNAEYFNRSVSELKEELQDINFTDEKADFREIKLKAENYFKDYPASEKEFVMISDFAVSLNLPDDLKNKDLNYHLVNNTAGEIINISLDSAFISNTNPETLSLNIRLSSNNAENRPVTVSVRDGEKLLGRNTVQFEENDKAEINFRLQNQAVENGRIEIEDSGLRYDNVLYFNIADRQAVKVVIISNAQDDFLERIYNEPEFETVVYEASQIDFNQLNSANLIVLNEVEQLASSLTNNLTNAQSNGASLLIIPSEQVFSYEQLLNGLGFSSFSQKITSERLITNIEYDHPLLEGVFEDRTENFEYPKVLTSFNLQVANAVLRYEDNQPFLAESNSAYLFTAPLNSENSNFKNSPLIVPVFYQIGLEALKRNQLYYQTNSENKIDIPVELGKDQVLHLTNPESDLIPQQQNYSNRVELNTANLPLKAGNYEVSGNNSRFGNLSFNYDRQESDLQSMDISGVNGVSIHDSVDEYFSEANAASQINALWKWFVIFALIFLAIEMLLIKFLK